MIKSKWQEYRDKNGTTPLDMLNPYTKKAEESIKNQRMSVCLTCSELIKLTKQCKKCGCFMEFKTGLDSSKCPIGKW